MVVIKLGMHPKSKGIRLHSLSERVYIDAFDLFTVLIAVGLAVVYDR